MAITMAPFYNVNSAVGPACQNFASDVMLVQYMLFHICVQPVPHWDKQHNVWTPNSPGIGPQAIFPYTGIYTPELERWIGNFQLTANERGYGPLKVDGRINRAPVGWGRPSKAIGAHWYTLQAMNRLLYQFNADSFANLPNLSDLPASLAADLNRNQFIAYDQPGG
jgi:hypothetical protein